MPVFHKRKLSACQQSVPALPAAAAAAAATTWIRNSSNNSISTEHQLLFTADTEMKKRSAPPETTSSFAFLLFFSAKKISRYDLIALKEQRREESMPFHPLHAFRLFQTVSDHKVQIVITDKGNINLYARHCSVGSSTSNDIMGRWRKRKYKSITKL